MGRTAAGFVLGFLIGFAGLQLALRAAVFYIDGTDDDAAQKHNMMVAEYRDWATNRYQRPFAAVSAVGALVCGVFGAVGFNQPVVSAGRRTRQSRGGSNEPLSRDEFHHVLQTCLWIPLDERSPEYVRGLAVGRLADNQPALAKKLDDFSDDQMAALHRELCRRRARGL